MESENAKSIIQDYDARLKLLSKEKRELKKERACLIRLLDKYTNIAGYSFAEFVIGKKRLQAFNDNYINNFLEQRSVERLRDSAIFYSKYESVANQDIIEKMEKINKQARLDQIERENIFGNTEVQRLKRKYWVPPKADL